MYKSGIYNDLPSNEEKRSDKTDLIERVIALADDIVDKQMRDQIIQDCQKAGLSSQEIEEALDKAKEAAEAEGIKYVIAKIRKIEKQHEALEGRKEHYPGLR